MFKLVVIAVVVACVSSSVVPKPPASHSDLKHEITAVKSAPIHPENHASTEHNKPAEVKTEVKHDDKAKSILSHDMKSDDKNKNHHHQSTTKKAEHQNDHHAALKHHEVPVNVGHGSKPFSAGQEKKSEKTDLTKAKPSDHGH